MAISGPGFNDRAILHFFTFDPMQKEIIAIVVVSCAVRVAVEGGGSGSIMTLSSCLIINCGK